MDSVTQKQNFLSLTGIDQTTENTESIESLNGTVVELQYEIDNIVQNDIPYYVSTQPIDQQIAGTKSFSDKIVTRGFEPFYNAAGTFVPIEFSTSKGLAKQYKLVFEPTLGVTIVGPLKLDDSVLQISNVTDLQRQLDKTFVIGDHSITKLQIAYNTILGNNLDPTIKILTTGDITATIGTFLGLEALLRVKAPEVDAGIFKILDPAAPATQYAAPLLTISIPCVPAVNDTVVIQGINFCVPNAIFVTSTGIPCCQTRYRHPTNFYVHSIAIVYNSDFSKFLRNTTDIRLYTYDPKGNSGDVAPYLKTLIATFNFVDNNDRLCDVITLATPARVSSGLSIGGDITFKLTTGTSPTVGPKKCSFIVYGYQA